MIHASKKVHMAGSPAQKIPLIFYKAPGGREPVRDWLKDLPEVDRRAVGLNLARVQYRWPVGMPLCRPMGNGLWEVRTDLSSHKTARVLFCFFDGELWALHGLIKKSRATPLSDLEVARKRMKDVVR